MAPGDRSPTTRANTAVRIGGFVLLLAASCGLAALHWDPGGLRAVRGRRAGAARSGTESLGALNPLGATLLLLAAWLAGTALAFHVSWLVVMDRTGHDFWRGVEFLREHFSTRREVAEGQERKRVAQGCGQKEQKKVAPRVAPVIEQPAPVAGEERRVPRRSGR